MPAAKDDSSFCCLAFPGTATPNSAGAALVAGDSAFANGEYSSAVSLYERAIQQDPTNLLPLTKRAAAYEKLGQHSAAVRDLTAALQIDSTSTRPLLQRSDQYSLHHQGSWQL